LLNKLEHITRVIEYTIEYCKFHLATFGESYSTGILFVFQPDGFNLTARDPRWIGAWWLGFVIFGILIFFLSILLLGFPRELPGAMEMREEHIKKGNIRKVKNSGRPTLKTILPELRDMLTNWTFLFNALGLTATIFYFGAVVPFYSKILGLKFGLIPEKIGYVLGSMMTPCMAGKAERKVNGTMLGRYFNL
jgi:hypothetical protein